jgi:hypothetical protein
MKHLTKDILHYANERVAKGALAWNIVLEVWTPDEIDYIIESNSIETIHALRKFFLKFFREVAAEIKRRGDTDEDVSS